MALSVQEPHKQGLQHSFLLRWQDLRWLLPNFRAQWHHKRTECQQWPKLLVMPPQTLIDPIKHILYTPSYIHTPAL